MGLNTGNTIVQGDFIKQAAKNVTPSADENRVPKLEADGKLAGFFTKNGQILNAGATINGATLPVPVYQNKTDNEVYACDANDTNALKFMGFGTSNGTDGNPITVQFSGVVGGFSALDEGEKYYVQDTVGTIGTTPGTYAILVGVAISTTELFIMKGNYFRNGTVSFSDAGAGGTVSTSAITLGFRPSVIRMRVYGNVANSDADVAHSSGTWVNGSYACVFLMTNTGGTSQLGNNTTFIGRLYSGNNEDSWTITITSVTDTGFTISATQNIATPVVCHIEWEAEGML
jgi:hypothetical protein